MNVPFWTKFAKEFGSVPVKLAYMGAMKRTLLKRSLDALKPETARKLHWNMALSRDITGCAAARAQRREGDVRSNNNRVIENTSHRN